MVVSCAITGGLLPYPCFGGDVDTHNVKVTLKNPGPISGPTPICNGQTRTYFVPLFQNGAEDCEFHHQYLWTVPSGWLVNGQASYQGTNVVSIKAPNTGSGSGTIKVKGVLHQAGDTPEASLSVTLDVPSASSVSISGPVAPCAGSSNTYTANAPGNPSDYSYTWTYPSGWVKLWQIQNQIRLRTPSSGGWGSLDVNLSNACGSSGFSGITVFPTSCGYFSVYPNPASDFIQIEYISEELKSQVQLEEYSAELFDKNGEAKRSVKTSKKQLRLNIANLPRGLYYLKINLGKKLENFRILIE